MSTKITRINEIAKERPNEVFTSIYHLVNKELLMECFKELDGSKATGLDNITKDDYKQNLENNLDILVEKLKNKSFRPSPARTTKIPKSNGKTRTLAIANFEDKIVQLAFKKLIEAIFEPKFPNSMFGFRPNRGCHDALRQVSKDIEWQYTNYVLEADIMGYFDNIDHDKLIKCLELHIKDPNVIRMIKRFLKAGVIEDNKYYVSETGTPQGSILSPILANIYMYYILIKWFETEVRRKCKGFASIINYADDFICCFSYKSEAEKFYKELLPNRLRLGNLKLAKEKTRLLAFGRYANANSPTGKAETFDFLGFTHYCSKSSKGNFRVKRKTSKKKFRDKVKDFKIWIKDNRHLPLGDLLMTVRRKLTGHFNYYGITDNFHMIKKFRWVVLGYLFKYLNRRSQRESFTWSQFEDLIEFAGIPRAKIKVSIYAN